MGPLLIVIVAVGIALAIVSAICWELLAKAEPTTQPCCGCAPCHNACQRKGVA